MVRFNFSRRQISLLVLCLAALFGGVVPALVSDGPGKLSEATLSLGPASPAATRVTANPGEDAGVSAGAALGGLPLGLPTAPATSAAPSGPATSIPAAPSGPVTSIPPDTGGLTSAPSQPATSASTPAPSQPATVSPAPPVQPIAGSASARLRVGVGDGNPGVFTNAWFRKLPIRIARYVVPWNAAVTRSRTALNQAKAWVHSALAVHAQPMVSFGAPPGNAGNYIPSDKVYTAAVKAFIRAVPQVKTYTPWNEPEFPYRSLSRNPGLAAAYFNTMASVCHGCTVVAGDLFLPANDGLGSWISAYRRGLRHIPSAWAIHPYNDVRTHTTSQISTLERFAHPKQIWLDEISGVERRGHWPYPNQSPNAADNDERFLFTLPKRFHNITRIYHYQWQAVAAAPWDSGLLGPGGKPRPAYWTFGDAVKGKLP